MCVCVCVRPVWPMDVRPGGSVTSQRQLLVGYGKYRVRDLCVCPRSFGEGLAVWVLLPRVDRGRRADRIGIGLTDTYQSDHVVQPPRICQPVG